MKIGYARVSTEEQSLDLQRDALSSAGCHLIIEEKVSSTRPGRKGLYRAMRRCKAGDVLVVWKLDRLGRSLFDLIDCAKALNARGVGLKILSGCGSAVDTTTSMGRMFFAILAGMADMERELISDRTRAGIAAARARGIKLGRPPKLTENQLQLAGTYLEMRSKNAEAIAQEFGVHVTTLRRALRVYRPSPGLRDVEAMRQRSGHSRSKAACTETRRKSEHSVFRPNVEEGK